MKSTKLPNFPTGLPANVEVLDIDHEDGKFSRTILEAYVEQHAGDDHYVIHAQTYEMDAAGNFIQAPLGYPSRTRRTATTVSMSTLGITAGLTDGWYQSTAPYDPANPGDVVEVANKPATKPAKGFGEQRWVTSEQKLYVYAEGIKNTVNRTKIDELKNVIATSGVRSGTSFR